MPKLVLFLFLGLCVMAVNMAPVDDAVEILLELIHSYGPQVEKKLQETEPSFSWESWFTKSKPVLRGLTKFVRPDPENVFFCREDDEAFVNSHGEKIAKEVQATADATFNWSSWWSEAKHILMVLGDFVDPLAQKSYCNVNGLVIAGETIPAGDYSLNEQIEKLMTLVNSYGPQAEKEIQKTEASFNWNRWWSESKPVMVAMNLLVPPNPAYRTNFCREDEEAFVNLYGHLIEEAVHKTNPSFNWNNWWGPARYVLKVTGALVNPVADKPYCSSNDEKDKERLESLRKAYEPWLKEKKNLELQALVNQHGKEIEEKVRITNPSFSWDRWWSEASPILKVINLLVKPLNETKDKHCRTDGDEQKNEEHVNSYGPEVEKAIQKTNPAFDWNSWWNEAKPILRIIGKVVQPIAKSSETYCQDDNVKPKAA